MIITKREAICIISRQVPKAVRRENFLKSDVLSVKNVHFPAIYILVIMAAHEEYLCLI